MRISHTHIAGVGVSQGIDPVAAATQALLDAGLVYSDVDFSLFGFVDQKQRIAKSSLDIFGPHRSPALSIDNDYLLFAAAQSIRSREANCVLLIGIDYATAKRHGATPPAVAVGMILVSDLFLTSHAYLKDAAICIRSLSLAKRGHRDAHRKAVHSALRKACVDAKDIQMIESQHGPDDQSALSDFSVGRPQGPSDQSLGSSGLAGLCGLAWQLRGWADAQKPLASSQVQIHTCLQYIPTQDGSASVLIVSRSDGKRAPAWSDVEHLRDGRERLGYNPAIETRGIANEDLLAVTARDKFTSTGDKVESMAAFKHLRLCSKGGDRAALARL